ncbi:hypothetical protein FIV34_17510 [Luteibacter pinisoli]|uniref:Uncharacterized protein n=1 Tax=Luteibacter pinisoli TaxID=2589080 RepID=A0A4Y5Z6N5_9GAMM|nr:hypothetical protein [Luteibacter pinisoli]QDE40877.1 hypothetical protein FIV34_17510 [Luteibacter pinisoli]
MSRTWIYTLMVSVIAFFTDWIDYNLGGIALFAIGIPYILLSRYVADRFGDDGRADAWRLRSRMHVMRDLVRKTFGLPPIRRSWPMTKAGERKRSKSMGSAFRSEMQRAVISDLRCRGFECSPADRGAYDPRFQQRTYPFGLMRRRRDSGIDVVEIMMHGFAPFSFYIQFFRTPDDSPDSPLTDPVDVFESPNPDSKYLLCASTLGRQLHRLAPPGGAADAEYLASAVNRVASLLPQIDDMLIWGRFGSHVTATGHGPLRRSTRLATCLYVVGMVAIVVIYVALG